MIHLRVKCLLISMATIPLLGCPPKGIEQSGPLTSENKQGAMTSQLEFPSPDPISKRSSAKDGFDFMLRSILFVSQSGQSIETLLNLLLRSKQKPRVYTDHSDSLLENHIVIRTNRPTKGTRYFQGIYLSMDKKLTLSHLSFETSLSFDDARKAVEELIGKRVQISGPEELADGNIAWGLWNQYHIRVKKLVSDDLINHPTNAYTKDDIGTVVVMVEKLQDL